MEIIQASLTTTEVAERLRVSEEVVRRHARDGSLRGFQIGRRWRFDVAALQRFVDERERQAVVTDPPDEARAAS